MDTKSPLAGIKNGKKLIKRYFLVDYENVQAHGLAGLSQLNSTDSVTVYFSKNADTMSFELHMELNACRARTDFQKVCTGVKNALDFQLSSQLGYIINQNLVANSKGVKYYIVSGDNGFSCLCSFWEKFGAEVELVRSIDSALNPKRGGELAALLSDFGLSERDETAVAECVAEASSSSELHNLLQKRLCTPVLATEIYHALKPAVSIRNREEVSDGREGSQQKRR